MAPDPTELMTTLPVRNTKTLAKNDDKSDQGHSIQNNEERSLPSLAQQAAMTGDAHNPFSYSYDTKGNQLWQSSRYTSNRATSSMASSPTHAKAFNFRNNTSIAQMTSPALYASANTNVSRASDSLSQSQVSSRTRHNRAEQKRRQQMRDSFDRLKSAIPSCCEQRKISKVALLKEAHRYICELQQMTDELKKHNQALQSHQAVGTIDGTSLLPKKRILSNTSILPGGPDLKRQKTSDVHSPVLSPNSVALSATSTIGNVNVPSKS
eukprot:TRINITY_DN3823_c0_g1_i1.p1 TRINITY_DN3823_c0_g1~~TRINITY_DN3823_c0_g1_i1.p1  ORF type:complete len:266 (-),score=31.90 TRINITY_DN3823_c0_g1_i1:37-834(-)